jgi:hypothetical protein
LRAVQEYLWWIAEDCAILLTAIRLDTTESSPEAIARQAIRLRVISLAFWGVLWIEYLIPALRIRPFQTIRSYEEFWRSAEMYLRRDQLQMAMPGNPGPLNA